MCFDDPGHGDRDRRRPRPVRRQVVDPRSASRGWDYSGYDPNDMRPGILMRDIGRQVVADSDRRGRWTGDRVSDLAENIDRSYKGRSGRYAKKVNRSDRR